MFRYVLFWSCSAFPGTLATQLASWYVIRTLVCGTIYAQYAISFAPVCHRTGYYCEGCAFLQIHPSQASLGASFLPCSLSGIIVASGTNSMSAPLLFSWAKSHM